MRIPKKYGLSKIDSCPFCEKTATTKNSQEVPVCQQHKSRILADLKCVCGGWLDVQESKWGPYFRCINCGNINFKKGIEINPQIRSNSPANSDKEITVTSDELDFI